MSFVNYYSVGAFFLTSLVFVLYAPSDCDQFNRTRKKNRKSKNVASKIREEYSGINWENWKLLKSYLDDLLVGHNYWQLGNDDTESEDTEEIIDANNNLRSVSEYVDAASQLHKYDSYLDDSTKYYESGHLFNKVEEKKHRTLKNHLQGMLNRTKNAFKSHAKKINSKFNKTNSYVALNSDQSKWSK
ncbi:uncharacterized protein LOC106660070 [Trichogramma pretiosum]|uniref:uncharacterized protein LOC106660070 n=1 Tax=Trichogramma pretiosum TaxID=7493 RepID=UPI0006C97099|nr:uncharacterized protein LOC106660070 [Trichogramma pretiosum]